MKKQIFYILAFAFIMVIGCQKEKSFEQGNSPSGGSLQSDVAGDCLPKTVNGIYLAGTALVAATNTITVDVNVVKTGTYLITTDTVNGYYFRANGTFTTPGINTISLQGNGTPFAAGTNNFVVTFDTTSCDIQVTVLPAGTGAAVFTLQQTGGNCTPGTVTGTYILGQALGATNSAVINVNVTVIGTYTISTVFQGMTFISTGAFTTLGPQPVTLFGSGTPTTGGANVVPVTVGATTCSFTVNVQSTAAGTLGGGPGACTPSTVNGTYFVGVPLAATNTVQVQINVTTPGAYSISTNTVAGMSFSGTGTAVAGAQNITLNGTGTPSASGAQTFTVTFGTSTCTFSVNVQQGNAVGTLGGGPGACTPSTVNGTYTVGTALTATNTVQVQVNATTAGAYTISTNTVTGFSFSATGVATLGTQNITLNGTGTPTTSGAQSFTVTFGTSTCTFTVNVQAALSNDYFPRTTNSNWSYEFDDDAMDSLYRVATANTHMALGNTYTIFMANDGSGLDSSGYYRKNGGDYFEWFDFGSFVGYDNPVWGEYIMVKDNVANGTIWKSNGFAGTVNGGTAINARFSFTIFQKDVSITVQASTGSTTYQNVIVVDERLEVEVAPGVWQDVTSQIDYYGRSYYARGIGLIKFEAYDASNVLQFLQEMRRNQVF